MDREKAKGILRKHMNYHGSTYHAVLKCDNLTDNGSREWDLCWQAAKALNYAWSLGKSVSGTWHHVTINPRRAYSTHH